MTPRHPLPPPAPRRSEAPPRPEFPASAWPARADKDADLRSETFAEGECFEQLLMGGDLAGQGALADYTGAQGGNGEPSAQGNAEADTPAPPCAQTAELWRTLLARLDDRLGCAPDGAVQAQIELPSLGLVAVRVIPVGSELEIVLRFADDAARRACDTRRQASAQWLGEQLGRRVTLRLHGEAH